MDSYEEKIVPELENLYSTLGQFHNLSENIIQHALSSSDSKVNYFEYLPTKNILKFLNTFC